LAYAPRGALQCGEVSTLGSTRAGTKPSESVDFAGPHLHRDLRKRRSVSIRLQSEQRYRITLSPSASGSIDSSLMARLQPMQTMRSTSGLLSSFTLLTTDALEFLRTLFNRHELTGWFVPLGPGLFTLHFGRKLRALLDRPCGRYRQPVY
jgi:hypothetical protein